MKKEEMCSIDGEPCVWISEEEYTVEGRCVVEVFCEKCFRYRDRLRREEAILPDVKFRSIEDKL